MIVKKPSPRAPFQPTESDSLGMVSANLHFYQALGLHTLKSKNLTYEIKFKFLGIHSKDSPLCDAVSLFIPRHYSYQWGNACISVHIMLFQDPLSLYMTWPRIAHLTISVDPFISESSADNKLYEGHDPVCFHSCILSALYSAST